MELNAILENLSLKNLTSVTHVLLFTTVGCIIWMVLHGLVRWYEIRRKIPPGPWGLPIVGYLPFMGNEPHKTFWNMKEKYGDIISVYLGTKFMVILNEYTVAKEFLGNNACLDRGPDFFNHLNRTGFSTENGDRWLEQRRFCFTAAKDLGLGKSNGEAMILEEISNFTRKLENLKGKPTDISHELEFSLISNIMTLMIGRRLKEHQESEKIQVSKDYSDAALKLAAPSIAIAAMPTVRKVCEFFKIGDFDKYAKVIQEFESFIRQEVTLHKVSPDLSDKQDFINTYLNKMSELAESNKKDHSFSEIMLEGNVAMLFLGASDTMFSTLTWLFRLMCVYKDVQDKVHAELMEVVGKSGIARYEEKNQIPYTIAVLMETLRYSSSSPFNPPRKTGQDIYLKGYLIPKGSEVITNLWGLHRDPSYWDEPEVFRPERFLTDGGTKVIKQPPSFAPFSLGRRNCPGETIAWRQTLLYFSEVIKKFEISTAPGVKAELKVMNGLVAHLVPQQLCFKERNI